MTALQQTIGNRAVQRLVAVQREATAEQKQELAGYLAGGDWGRAAWVLDTWQPADIATRIKGFNAAQLESLNEGAWHGGKGNVENEGQGRDFGGVNVLYSDLSVSSALVFHGGWNRIE